MAASSSVSLLARSLVVPGRNAANAGFIFANGSVPVPPFCLQQSPHRVMAPVVWTALLHVTAGEHTQVGGVLYLHLSISLEWKIGALLSFFSRTSDLIALAGLFLRNCTL